MADRVEIRVQDYRELGGERFDAIASIGMVEHVGEEQIDVYAAALARAAWSRAGKLLNHGIARLRHSDAPAGPFSERYVFPDGEPLQLSRVLLALERAGFETHHVEDFRDDYAETLRHWARQPRRALRGGAAGRRRARARVAAVPARGAQRVRDRLHVDLPGALQPELTWPTRRSTTSAPTTRR